MDKKEHSNIPESADILNELKNLEQVELTDDHAINKIEIQTKKDSLL